ncbi:hypothetical protein Q5762_22545 [Streptomyces sp. P9(2023)]|nr:hypothetical protein [Streptomyces sp. P9(2023)]MDT9691077.1 hypothetical protein [Streptomyces sp. P9(2023)]
MAATGLIRGCVEAECPWNRPVTQAAQILIATAPEPVDSGATDPAA